MSCSICICHLGLMVTPHTDFKEAYGHIDMDSGLSRRPTAHSSRIYECTSNSHTNHRSPYRRRFSYCLPWTSGQAEKPTMAWTNVALNPNPIHSFHCSQSLRTKASEQSQSHSPALSEWFCLLCFEESWSGSLSWLQPFMYKSLTRTSSYLWLSWLYCLFVYMCEHKKNKYIYYIYARPWRTAVYRCM